MATNVRIRSLPIEERIRIYNKAWMLRNNFKLGYKRASVTLGISVDVVRHWFHHGRNPLNEMFRNKFEEKASPELSYVIGVVMGDCNLQIRKGKRGVNHSIRLRVKDKEFAEKFSIEIAKLLNKKRSYKLGRERDQYRVVVCSHQLYNFLKKPFEELKPFIKAFPTEFIRGLSDSEGAVVVTICKHKQDSWLQFYIAITNTNIKLLKFIQSLLDRNFGINSCINISHKKGTACFFLGREYKRNADAYDLKIYKLKNLKVFNHKIGFTIIEKQYKINKAISLFENFKRKERVYEWLRDYTKIKNRWYRKNYEDYIVGTESGSRINRRPY